MKKEKEEVAHSATLKLGSKFTLSTGTVVWVARITKTCVWFSWEGMNQFNLSFADVEASLSNGTFK